MQPQVVWLCHTQEANTSKSLLEKKKSGIPLGIVKSGMKLTHECEIDSHPIAQENCPVQETYGTFGKPPPLTLGGRVPLPAAWTAAATINWVLAGGWLVAGTGFGIYYAVAAIVGQASKFGLFADCYQCAAPRGAGAG